MSANEAITNEQITQRNEKLFNSFRKKFQSLVEKDYIDSVHKFKAWLSDRRAYYDAARPRIVELLHVARDTILLSSGGKAFEQPDSCDPSLETRRSAYLSCLACVTNGHLDRFPEVALRDSLLDLARLAGDAIQQPTSVPSHSTLKIQSKQSQEPVKTAPSISEPVSAQSAVPRPSFGKNMENNSSSSKGVESSPINQPASTATLAMELPKSSTPILSSQTVLTSQNNFEEKKPATEPSKTAQGEPVNQIERTGSKSQVAHTVNPQTPHGISHSPPIKPNVVPPTPSTSPPLLRNNPMNPITTLPASRMSEIASIPPSSPNLLPQESLSRTSSSNASAPISTPKPRAKLKLGKLKATKARNSLLADDLGQADLEEYQRRMKGSPLIPSTSHINNKMEVDNLTPNPQTPTAPVTVPGGSARSTETNRAGERSIPVNGHGHEPSVPKVDIQNSPNPPFSAESMEILGLHGGSKDGSNLVMRFDLNETHFKQLLVWSLGAMYMRQRHRSICVSLVCYPSSQLTSITDQEQLKRSFSSQSCIWPEDRKMKLIINEASECAIAVNLSPPRKVTDIGYVDLSMFVEKGAATLTIQSEQSTSDLLFAILAHPPTETQEVAKGDPNSSWSKTLANLRVPFTLPDINFD